MQDQAIMVSSITYALKAQELLQKRGIFSYVEKTPKELSGRSCGYSLIIKDTSRYREAVELLMSYDIRILKPSEGS